MSKYQKLFRRPTWLKTYRTFAVMPTWLLAVLGGGSFLIAGYWSTMLANVVPHLIEDTNRYGLPPMALGLWFLVGIFALGVWFFGSTALRCHNLINKRWWR
jgi:hypothetical protein